MLGSGQSFSTRLINGLGSGWEILNLFNFDMNTNPTLPDSFFNSNRYTW